MVWLYTLQFTCVASLCCECVIFCEAGKWSVYVCGKKHKLGWMDAIEEED